MIFHSLCEVFMFDAHLPHSFPFDGELLHLREIVVKGHDVSDDGLLIWVLCENIYNTHKKRLLSY